jgi:16S rRNA processing protein RimM
VGRPHGLDGSFHVLTRDPDLLADVVLLAGTERRVVRRAGTDRRPLMRVEGVDTREAADALRGEPLWVERPPLAEDEYWAEDLVGCEVVGVGRVVRMLEYPSCEVLETDDGSMVPLVRDAIASIDVGARRIELREGFLGDAD